jgi:acyl carrier protein
MPRLINMYGITETTVHVTYRPITQADLNSSAGSVIGRPIPDLGVYILDSRQHLQPVGVPGEIYVGGAGIARGYLRRPELTAERFIADPLGRNPQARLYRSGDLARWLPSGELEYEGRIDDQVKIRGYRIELGEIEAALSDHRHVREAVVIARQDTPGDKRLVAYVAADAKLAMQELRRHLTAKLPDYMIPSAFISLDALPLTSNGKVDRAALPLPDQNRPELSLSYVGPRTDIEATLCEVFAVMLRLDKVGIHDNFFDLGGHSLLATQAVSRMREALRKDIPLRHLFEAPTVSELALLVAKSDGRSDAPAIVRASRDLYRLKLEN